MLLLKFYLLTYLFKDPCADARHHQPLWNDTEKYCQVNKVSRISRLPDVLIVGPQKTGTAALYSYLSMHPDIHKSRQSNSSFEEIQFFNRNHYMKGLRWYGSIYFFLIFYTDLIVHRIEQHWF